MEEDALADAQPDTTSAASKSALAMPRTDLNLRMISGYRQP